MPLASNKSERTLGGGPPNLPRSDLADRARASYANTLGKVVTVNSQQPWATRGQ